MRGRPFPAVGKSQQNLTIWKVTPGKGRNPLANNGAFIDKGTLLAQLEWMRDGGTQYDRFRTPAEVDAYNAALRDVTQRIKRMPTRCVTNSWTGIQRRASE